MADCNSRLDNIEPLLLTFNIARLQCPNDPSEDCTAVLGTDTVPITPAGQWEWFYQIVSNV